MRRSKGLRTTIGPLVAGMLAVALVTGCGGGAQVAGDAEEIAQESTEAADDMNATEDDQLLMLADHDGIVLTKEGDKTTLTDYAAGRPLVVNFWTTWCPYCVEEMPDFARVVDDYQGRVAFAFVDVADGSAETVENATAWLEENGLETLPVCFETPETNFELSRALDVMAYPTTLVVDANGEILTRSAGAVDMALLREALDTLV